MRGGIKITRLCGLMAVLLALSGMAGCPQSSDFQNGNHRTDSQPDHAGPGTNAMDHTMGGGMGMP